MSQGNVARREAIDKPQRTVNDPAFGPQREHEIAVDAVTNPTAARADNEAGVVASSVYANGRRVKDIAIDEAGEWSKRPGHVVWIGLLEPSVGLLQRVQEQLGLHYLAIEDASKAHQHPKIEQYGDALFIVARPRN